MGLGAITSACTPTHTFSDASSLMLDCQYKSNQDIHLHVSEKRGAVTVVSDYVPGTHPTHAEDLRSGTESEGRLINSPRNRFKVQLFLLNDNFGQKIGEQVLLQVNDDGSSLLEAKGPDGVIRTLDSGTCTLPASAHT